MPWLVRFTPPAGADTASLSGAGIASPPGPFERHELLVSEIWDLGTSGVFEQDSELVAGFDRLESAQRAAELGRRHDLAAEIETVDESWVRHDSVEVTLPTTTGVVAFSIVAGAAFGHGGHPTTRLCLDLMGRVLDGSEPPVGAGSGGARVLDLGTGSGVLAIAAKRLGAGTVTASDVDPVAIESARFNFAANAVDADVVHGDVGELVMLTEILDGRFDLIVANVLLAIHEHVAPTAAAQLLKSGGCVIIAGFLNHQADRAVSAYRRTRPTLEVVHRAEIGEWCGVVLAEQPLTG